MKEKIIYLRTKDREVWAIWNDDSQRIIRKGSYGISFNVIGVGCWNDLLERYLKMYEKITGDEFWKETQRISEELENFQNTFKHWTEHESVTEEQREAIRYKTTVVQKVGEDASF